MIRTTNKKPSQVDAILTADWHLRETTPVCRTDDFWQTQWKKVDFISDLQKEYNCPVFHGGDLFDYWKPSPMLLSETIKHLPKQFFSCYGNHDLPQHNLEFKYKSGLYTLEQAGILKTSAKNCGFGMEIRHWNETPLNDIYTNVLLWHVYNYQGKDPWPGCTSPKAGKLLRQYPQYDLIVTGDNHTPFIEEYEGRLLVNPGSIFRMDADQTEHRPRVYLYNAEKMEVTPVYLPIEKDVISREHIEIKEQRDNRIEAFVSQLNGDWAASLSFEDNLKQFTQTNEVRQSVMDLVYKAIEV